LRKSKTRWCWIHNKDKDWIFKVNWRWVTKIKILMVKRYFDISLNRKNLTFWFKNITNGKKKVKDISKKKIFRLYTFKNHLILVEAFFFPHTLDRKYEQVSHFQFFFITIYKFLVCLWVQPNSDIDMLISVPWFFHFSFLFFFLAKQRKIKMNDWFINLIVKRWFLTHNPNFDLKKYMSVDLEKDNLFD
jgi:hypothetical protein